MAGMIVMPTTMRRRAVLLSMPVAALGAWAPHARAAAATPARVGVLFLGSPAQRDEIDRNLLAGLAELGYVEGRNLVLERGYAHSESARLPALAQAFAAGKVDAIVTTCTPTTRAARAASGSIPIVMIAVSDPVAAALVKSLAQPGGNVTGRSSQSNDIVPKSLGLFARSAPRMQSLAVLVNVNNPAHEALWRDTAAAAQPLKITLQLVEIRSAENVRGEDLPRAFERIGAARADGVFVLPDDPLGLLNRSRIVELAQRARLPALYGAAEFAESGGFMSYGENVGDSARQSARHVDKLLKGANPATLPVEQPTRFELVVNLKAARGLGIAVPRDVLVQADRVIE